MRKEPSSQAPTTPRKWGLRLLLATAIALFCAGLALVGYLVLRAAVTDNAQERQADEAAERVARWPSAKQKRALVAAQTYNATLARLATQNAQPIGQQSDPFAQSMAHRSRLTLHQENIIQQREPGTGTVLQQLRREYPHILDEGDGIMGSIKIPKISVNLPIYHGTSDAVLAAGAGHIEGTSLPVGGKSTHAVISAHRGLPTALMFTRIDELRSGDVFYIRTLGRTMAYKVDQIRVITPNNPKPLRIIPGEDRVTLYTCTPYGVNTMRLLVSGHRAKYPQQVPSPNTNVVDWAKILFLTFLAIFLGLLLFLFVRIALRRPLIAQHGPIGRHEKWIRSVSRIAYVRNDPTTGISFRRL